MNSMSKAVFRPAEVALSSIKVVLDPPHVFPELAHLAPPPEEPEEVLAVEEYRGPTAEELRREAEDFKEQWELQKEDMIQAAKDEAARIVQEAWENANEEKERGSLAAEAIRKDAEAEAEKILEEGRNKAAEFEAASQASVEASRKEAEEQGRGEGREAGYAEGRAEAERLIERLRAVLERAQDKRAEILAETEQQIVDLVLLLTRKVVKAVSETQKDVVVSNILQALRKVKGRGNISIRLNLEDLKLAAEHTRDFIQAVEGGSPIQIVEDGSVDRGGCIIETDFGEVDARISSQLAELEARILEISPVKNRPKAAPEDPGDEDGAPGSSGA